MRFLRLLLAGFIALAVMAAGLFVAAVVVLSGLAAYVVQLFRGKKVPAGSSRSQAPNRQPGMRTDDVIDV
jgi:hypothetical protein